MLKVRFGLRARFWSILIGLSGIFLGAVGYRYFGDTWVLVIVVFVSLTAVQVLLPYIIQRRIYHRNPQLFEMRTVTFNDEGVKS